MVGVHVCKQGRDCKCARCLQPTRVLDNVLSQDNPTLPQSAAWSHSMLSTNLDLQSREADPPGHLLLQQLLGPLQFLLCNAGGFKGLQQRSV